MAECSLGGHLLENGMNVCGLADARNPLPLQALDEVGPVHGSEALVQLCFPGPGGIDGPVVGTSV